MKNINITKNPAGKLTLELICFSAVIFIIAATFKYITKNYSPDNFTHYFPVPRDDLLLYISIVGGFLISTLFKVTGKSIKSLNDTILFFRHLLFSIKHILFLMRILFLNLKE
jgi:hypothetical protein